jgi:hypothetical protein
MGHLPRLGQNILREDARQLVLADHHLHIHAEVVRRAEHLDHTADGRPGRGGPTGDLHIDNQTLQIIVDCGGRRLRAQHPVRRRGFAGRGQLLSGGNKNRLGHALVERDH